MKTIVYLNLTNGIESIGDFPDARFIRLQTVSCEQKKWDFLLQDLDYDFLLNLALGNIVFVIDYSQKHEFSRALWQGIPFIEYVLNRFWLGVEKETYVKSFNCTEYFNECYNNLSKRTFKKLEYFKKFLNTDSILIYYIGYQTTHDGDYKYYKERLLDALDNK